MPSYDYECRDCGHIFEEFQSMQDQPLLDCPSCGKPELRRLIGGGMGVIFKGSGYYVTDSRKASGKTESAGSGGAASTATSSNSSSSSSASGSGSSGSSAAATGTATK